MNIDLYNEHFGFSERPFSIVPDPDFLFWSGQHQRAFAVLEYGLLTKAPITMVTGEVGTGKTTLIQELLRKLEAHMTIGLISNAQGDRGDLLRWVRNAYDFPVPDNADYVALFSAFQEFVLGEYAAGRHVVLIIDEGQNLGADTLEELRLLTNLNSCKDELLQIVLVGQPELRDIVNQPRLRQFAQRISVSFHINPMDLATTRDYVRHRLLHAGGSGGEISDEAIRLVHEHSTGIPRIVNKLCDLALVYAASGGDSVVDAATIEDLVLDGLISKPKSEPVLVMRKET